MKNKQSLSYYENRYGRPIHFLLKNEDLCQKNTMNSPLTSDTFSVYNVVY